ncbi:MAG: hypothetical protein ACJAU0_002180 [Flavobacteriales bacterium]|jgi:hypothetical protein
MRMLKSIFLFLFCLLFGLFSASVQLNAQEDATVTISLINASTKAPISGAYLSILPTQNRGEISNKSGESVFIVRSNDLCLRVSHIQYQDTTFCFSDLLRGEKRSITIELRETQVNLAYAVVTSGPDTVFGHDLYHVADYMLGPKQLYLLVYENEKMFKGPNEQKEDQFTGCRVILKKEGKTKSVVSRQICLGFYNQYPGQCILETKQGRYWVLETENELVLQAIAPEEFKSNIAPVVDTLGNKIFASTFFENYPAFDYLHFSLTDTASQVLVSIKDDWMMEQFRSEYKWLSGRGKLEAYRTELRTGVDKEVVGGFMSGFTESIYFEPLYAPLFASQDQVYIFDHYRDLLYRVDENAVIQDSVPISYHKEKEARFWQEKILFDAIQERSYAVYEHLGKSYLKQINLETGSMGEPIELTFRYPERINVYNDEVYYLYRPFESSQKKYLYREVIDISR